MCDCVSSTIAFILPYPRSIKCASSRTTQFLIHTFDSSSPRNFIRASFTPNYANTNPTESAKSLRNSPSTGSSKYDFYSELGFTKEKKKVGIEQPVTQNGNVDETPTSAVNFLKFNGGESGGKLEDKELVKAEDGSIAARRRGRQLMKRSNMLAKQVISIQSALSIGFVSQLWVDTISWVVMVVEVRPSLLSGDIERFFLKDISQVGDVVLIQDESVIENDVKMTGLETLVGYKVVTPGRQNIGKVRGYVYNINSGAVESLEVDSFGVSIIPSSLVSTYGLNIGDVLNVAFDTVVVHEAAASRMQRLTKGFWDPQKPESSSVDDIEDYSELDEETTEFDRRQSRGKRFNQRLRPKEKESVDEWDLPMDYM